MYEKNENTITKITTGTDLLMPWGDRILLYS